MIAHHTKAKEKKKVYFFLKFTVRLCRNVVWICLVSVIDWQCEFSLNGFSHFMKSLSRSDDWCGFAVAFLYIYSSSFSFTRLSFFSLFFFFIFVRIVFIRYFTFVVFFFWIFLRLSEISFMKRGNRTRWLSFNN